MCKKSLLMMLLLALLVPWAANAQTSLWSEDFEGGSMPTGWTTDGPGTWSVGTGDYSTSTGAGQGSYNAKITHGTTGTVTKLITPEIDLSSVATAELSFMHVQRSWAGDIDELRVYYRTSSSGSWNQLVAYTGAIASWTTEDGIALPNLSSTYQLAFEYTDNYGYGVGVDNIVIVQGASCPKPAGLAISYTGGNTAQVSWNSEATAWNIDVNGTVTAITTNPYTLTGLEMATTYTVKVQANCGGGDLSDWSSAMSFTTDLCMPENMCEISYVLNDSYGDGWNGNAIKVTDVLTGSTITQLTLTSGSSASGSFAVCDGRQIQFSWVTGNYANETSYTVTDASGTVIFSGSGALSAPVNYTVDCPSCITPKNFTVSDITARSATLNWVSAGEAWQIDCNGEITDVTEKPVTLRLEPETEYTVKVRANCGGGDYSEWTSAVTFTTDVACPAPTDMVISDITAYSANVAWTSDNTNIEMRYTTDLGPNNDFEAGLRNWTTIDADGDGNDWYTLNWIEAGWDENGAHGGDTWATSASYSSYALTPDNYLVSPQITLGGSISFWACAQDAAWAAEHFGVAVSTTGNTDAADFTTIAEWTIGSRNVPMLRSSNAPRGGNRAQSEWVLYTVDLSAYSGQGYVAIRHFDCTDMFRLNVDDINIEQPGFELPWVYVTNPASPQALTNLEPETTYWVQVRANCGSDGYSEWLEGTFTTPPTCMVPTNLVISNVDKRSADLAWTSNGDETAWQIMINNDSVNLIDVTDTTYYSFTGLTPETAYSVRVRGNCGEVNGYSDWSVPATFTTLIACPAPTNLAVSDIAADTAVVSWTSETDIELQYAEDVWKHYDNGVYATSMGAGGTIYWGMMLPAESLTAGEPLTKVALHTSYAGEATLNVYLGGDQPTGTPAATQTFTMAGDRDFMEITLDTPVAIDGTQNLWITFYQSGLTYSADGCAGPTDPNGRWVSLDGEEWADIADYGYDYTWMIRAGFGDAQTNWVTVEDAASPQTIEGLTPNTDYFVRVKDICGGIDGESVWVTTMFTTLPTCWTPTDVVVSGVDYEQAIVDWTPNTNGTETAWQIEVADDQEPPVVTIYDVTAHPDTLRGLFDDTEYTVRVRANCGEDTYSDWTEPVTFTTLSYCEAPEIDSVTNIAARTASVYWTGIQIQEKYNVRYGVEVDPTIFLNVDFEDGVIPATWTNDATYAWTVVNDTVAGKKYMKSSNAGVSSSTSVIAATATYSADGFISFDALCMGEGSSTYYDHCDFYIDGTRVLYAGANISGWNNYKFAVTAGEHTFKWSYTKDSSVNPTGDYFAVDNIVMGLTNYEWEPVVENIEGNTYGLTGLTPQTEYVVQVQGICPRGLTEWSVMVEFETVPSCFAPTEVVVSNIDAYQAVIDWTANNEETAWEIEVSDKSQTPPTITTWPATEHPFTLPGLFDETDYEVRVRANCGEYDGYSDWSEPVAFTTLSHCLTPEIGEITDTTATSATVNWTGHANAYDLMYGVYNSDIYLSENFENDTIIPATWTNDATYPWVFVNDTVAGKRYMMSSNGGVANSTSSISVTVNYTADGIVKFDLWSRGEGSDSNDWDNSRFYIDNEMMFRYGAHSDWESYSAVVTAGEHTFTWTFKKDGSVNAAGDYFAVDNIVMEHADITWAPMIANIADTTYTLTNLEPGTQYIVKVRGADCDSISWSNEVNFTTEEAPEPQGQTIEFVAGWNWISVNVEVEDPIAMLQALEAILGENANLIKNQSINTEYDPEWGWFGDLDEVGVTNEEMLMIYVTTPCEVMLEGTPVEPTMHSITINPGWNWIGYPVSEEMTLDEAFANFEAEAGDLIKDRSVTTEYDPDWGWFGDLETLVPGGGYMYYSASSEVKTLIFATPAKGAKSGK